MFGLTPEEEARVLAQKRAGLALRMLQFIAKRGRKGATCDECLEALGLPHQSGSPRFGELVRAGCLQTTSTSRATRSGKLATVHVIRPGATFDAYLNLKPKVRATGLPPKDAAVLAAGRKFLERWRKNASKAGKEQAVGGLVADLLKADKLTVSRAAPTLSPRTSPPTSVPPWRGSRPSPA
jgi:hypothetical protein